MSKMIKGRTPLLALILFALTAGQAIAADKVVVIPMAADTAMWALVGADGSVITQSGGITVARFSAGEYFVNFGRTVTGHAVIGTANTVFRMITTRVCGRPAGATGETIQCYYLYNKPEFVLVTTTSSDESRTDSDFYVAVLP